MLSVLGVIFFCILVLVLVILPLGFQVVRYLYIKQLRKDRELLSDEEVECLVRLRTVLGKDITPTGLPTPRTSVEMVDIVGDELTAGKFWQMGFLGQLSDKSFIMTIKGFIAADLFEQDINPA